MTGAFAIAGWMIIVGVFFVPATLIAWLLMKSFPRALAVAATFTAGALLGFIGAAALGLQLFHATTFGMGRDVFEMTFATAGAIAGGIVAVWILSRFSRQSPWRRS